MKNLRFRKVKGVYVLWLSGCEFKSVCALATKNAKTVKFVCLGANLSKRQTGREIRKGLKFHKRMEANNENQN